MDENRITTLKNENIIWAIYVLFAIAGTYANNLEIEDIKNNSNKNKKKYKTINVIILIIALFVYLYFLQLTYKRYKKNSKRNNILNLIASTLVFIAGIILLYTELNSDEIDINEL